MDGLLYDIIYIITNIFNTYITYRFMGIFFSKEDINKKIELISYSLYFAFGTAIYLCIGIPLINMMYNIIVLFFISFNYKSRMKTRLVSIAIVYIIMACIETVLVLLTDYFHKSILDKNEYSSIVGMVSIKIVSYAVVSILSRSKNLKSGEKISSSYWLCIILIPLSSIYIMLTIFSGSDFIPTRVVISITLLLLINFAIFYLYETLNAFLTERMQQSVIKEQNKSYSKQFAMMEEYLKATNELRHDLKNHLTSMSLLIQNGNTQEVLTHISDMIGVCTNQKEYSRSGNVVLDSILNFKLQKAASENIKISLNIHVPPQMDIPSFDMTIILGNLLDNALEALAMVDRTNRYLDIWAKYDRGRFILKLSNSFEGPILGNTSGLLTTKDEKLIHGIGLNNVRSTIQKYDGTIEIKYSDNVFSVSLLIYVD